MISMKRVKRLSKLQERAVCMLLKKQYENVSLMSQRLRNGISYYYLFYQDQLIVGLFLCMEVTMDKVTGSLWGHENQQGMIDLLKVQMNKLKIRELIIVAYKEEERPESNTADYWYSDYIMIRKPHSLEPQTEKKQLMLCPYEQNNQLFYYHILSDVFSMEECDIKERIDSMEQEKEMSGFILYNQEQESLGFVGCYQQEWSYTLFDIAIKKEYQGKGYGSCLLYLVMKQLPVKDKKLMLQVSSYNKAAVALYKKFGFLITEAADYYKVIISEH